MAIHADRDGGEDPSNRAETCADMARAQGYETAEQVEWWLWMFGCSRYDTTICPPCRESYAAMGVVTEDKPKDSHHALLHHLDHVIAEADAILSEGNH